MKQRTALITGASSGIGEAFAVAWRPDLVVKFSESLSNEVTQSDVCVTALCPGFTRSELHDVTGTVPWSVSFRRGCGWIRRRPPAKDLTRSWPERPFM